ncbi:MAG: AAA family ATPase [Prochlorotrichaceae cyanobacterium]
MSDQIETQDWRAALEQWLQGNNPKTMPSDLVEIHQQFLQRFPREKLGELTLENYAIGGKPDSFCHWIEFKTKSLGSVSGGSSDKWGIYWSKKDQDWRWNKALNSDTAEGAFEKLKTGLINLVQAADQNQFDQLDHIGSKQLGPNRNGLRAKPLSLYFPEQFLPIANPYHLIHFLNCLGQRPQSGLHNKNRQLLEFLRSQAEFSGMDTHGMMRFLYDVFPPGKQTVKTPPGNEKDVIDWPEEIVHLATLAEHNRNLILYGPPGTGKTYVVNRFTTFYLSEQLSTPLSPEQRRRDLVRPLTWHEVIALAMYLKPNKKLFKVAEIAEEAIIQDFWASTQTKKLTNQLWAMLQIHTSPNIQTVKYKTRLSPFLFEKTEQSEWCLTEEGEGYVEVKLANTLDELQNPEEANPDVSKYVRFVTFHQSFAYEEFVEGLKPVSDDGQISYEVVDGIFKDICRRAQNDPDHKYLLIIDEINRANIAKVFGELITLIEDDKRLNEENEITVQLPYSKESFGVPENLLILGTMNTADRSIALLDIALRRRFTFLEQMPNPALLGTVEGVNLANLLENLNRRLSALLGRDYQIGHSYLMGIDDLEALHFAWYNRIIPLLQEYFYNDWERLQAVIGDRFVRQEDLDDLTRKALGNFYNAETHYQVHRFEADSEFSQALVAIYT